VPVMQRYMVGLVAAVLVIVQIQQPYPEIAPLQHIPTLLLVFASPWLLRRWPLSNRAVLCLVIFFLLHTLGGRYTYSNVPYDAWSEAIFGQSLSAQFGWTRNHYDRLVHLAFGLLWVRPVCEWLLKYRAMSVRGGLVAAIAFVLAVSCLYEIFEWVLTIAAAGSLSEGYNGQQGDIWDAQKDMALALLGALVGIATFSVSST
jgi:putative membrane protein